MAINLKNYDPALIQGANIDIELSDVSIDDLTVAGDVTVNTNKFTVTAASGNTLVAGTLSVTGASTLTGLLTATAGVTSVADIVLESGTAVPATAGAVAAGAPITLYSTGIVIEVTSDVPTHTRPKGSICINTGGSTTNNRMYVNTDGAGTWTALTTAA